MKKEYPKVPKYYHDSVSVFLFLADDLALLEKVDGSNARLCMYDERFADQYGERIQSYNPEDGDVFLGSKSNIRGRLSDSLDSFDGAFVRIVKELRRRLDVPSLKELHYEYNTPLVLFGEHMVKHTLDYTYDESPPPAFLGFDVFKLSEFTEPPSNPYKERFEGFLPLDESLHVFDRLGLKTSPVLDRPDGINPNDITIPESAFAPIQAEGVVIRSDMYNRRVKYVSEEFKEHHTDVWGLREDQATSGSELFAARYLPNPRFRKTVLKLQYRTGDAEFSSDDVAAAAVADAWDEELYDIMDIREDLNPQDIYSLAEEWADAVLETMEINANLNETPMDTLWKGSVESIDEGVIETFYAPPDNDDWEEALQTADDPSKRLAYLLTDREEINRVATELAQENSRDIGRWLIKPTYEAYRDAVWYDHLERIATLDASFAPARVNEELLNNVRTIIDSRDDVDVPDSQGGEGMDSPFDLSDFGPDSQLSNDED